jgi:hypothetical protein
MADDDWTPVYEHVPPHPMCCDECKRNLARVARLDEVSRIAADWRFSDEHVGRVFRALASGGEGDNTSSGTSGPRRSRAPTISTAAPTAACGRSGSKRGSEGDDRG